MSGPFWTWKRPEGITLAFISQLHAFPASLSLFRHSKEHDLRCVLIHKVRC